MKVMKLGEAGRVAVMLSDDAALLLFTSKGRGLALEVPAIVAATLREDLRPVSASATAYRPAPPRAKWRQVKARLENNKTTDADRMALCDLLHYLGITETEPTT